MDVFNGYSLVQLHLFFNKQPVYKQLTVGCQIAKQLSGLKTLFH